MTEKPSTFNQINQQEVSAWSSGEHDLPTVLVERSDGRITAGRVEPSTRTVQFMGDEAGYEKTVPLEALSDQRQEELAEQLTRTRAIAETAIKGSSELITSVPDYLKLGSTMEGLGMKKPTADGSSQPASQAPDLRPVVGPRGGSPYFPTESDIPGQEKY